MGPFILLVGIYRDAALFFCINREFMGKLPRQESLFLTNSAN